MKILISGAGIAGLTLAALLLKRGHNVRVFEKSARLTEVGAGIQISANAGHVLKELGLADAVRGRSFVPSQWHMRTWLSGDVIIGADGVRSVLRQTIVGADKPFYSGNAAWRGTIDARRLPSEFSEGITTSFIGPGRHMVMYWLGQRDLLNFVTPVETDIASEESRTTRHDWQTLKDDFAGWHEDVQTVIDLTDRNACYRWALKIRGPVANFHTDRAVLIGDATHATLPFLAQGAAMAMEDAAVLDRLLAEDGYIPSALARFQLARRDRTARIVEGASKMARMFHMESEAALKNGLIKGADVARERDNRLYNYNPITVPLRQYSKC